MNTKRKEVNYLARKDLQTTNFEKPVHVKR